MATWPVRFDHKVVALKPSPLLGANSDEVLKDWLGMNAEQVSALHTDKVI